MHGLRFRWFHLLVLASMLLAPWIAAIQPVALAHSPGVWADASPDEPKGEQKSERYLRIVEDAGKSIALEIASRTFVHEDGAKPRIALVSVAHIADRSFYDAVAEKLAGYDVVLYEAVAPAAVRSSRGETQQEQIESTRQSMTFVASLVEQYRAVHGEYPADDASLERYVTSLEPIVRNWFRHAMIDPWGQRLNYERTDESQGYELYSNGPLEGEAEPAAGRIRFDGHRSIHPMPREESNLQKQLADALGLAYQLDSLPYESANWLISDMTAEDLLRAFSGAEADFEMFSGAIAGTTLPARLVGMLLRFIRMLDVMYEGAISDMVKVLFIEVLGDESIVQAGMQQMGGDFMKILIDKRNQVVIDDIEALLESSPEIESIAILYGAAHMPDMAERLANQLGYAGDEAVWLRAIAVDLTESRIDQRQLTQMRTAIRRMMQSQGLRNR
jgi:hypothetical protein